MKDVKMKVDKSLTRVLSPIADVELKLLRESLMTQGIMKPLIAYGGEVMDD